MDREKYEPPVLEKNENLREMTKFGNVVSGAGGGSWPSWPSWPHWPGR